MIRRLLVAAAAGGAMAAAACGGASGSGSGSTASTPNAAASAQTVTFTETEFKIDTASTNLKAGSYTFDVQNKGQFPHDLHVATPDGSEIGATSVIQPGQSGTLQVTLKPGTYSLKCNVDSHAARGMVSTLTVS